jgi:hypothetical protein
MLTPPPQFRFKAVSMELAVHLDDRRVDMLVITADGTTIAIECENDTILSVQRHIAAISDECPQIATWSRRHPTQSGDSSPGKTSYETNSALDAAISEGWPTALPDRAAI